MAKDQNKARGNAGKVSLKVSAPHVSSGKGGSGSDDNQENKAKARKGAMFLAAVVGIYIVYLVASGQMSQFLDALGRVDVSWVVRACLCFVMYYVFGVTAYGIAVYLDHDSPLGVRDLMSVEASGVFFGNLTPMMAGSVPSQIWRMTRSGLDVGEASATQFTRFIAYQFGVVLFATIMLIAKGPFFFETYGDLFILNILVFSVHFLELAGIFVICLCPKLVMRVGNWAIKFCTKHGWLKDPDHWDELVNVQVSEFAAAFKNAASDLPSMALTLFVTMCQLGSLYMIPWFVLRAFGIHEDFLECLAAGSMVQMVSSAVPLPGGTGGAEGGFIMFYGHMFGSATSAGFIIWRLVTFFGPTILAAPLLGLRSNGGDSIYVRVQRVKGRLHTPGSRKAGSASGATISGGRLHRRAKGSTVTVSHSTARAASRQAVSGQQAQRPKAEKTTKAEKSKPAGRRKKSGKGSSSKADGPLVVPGGIRIPMGPKAAPAKDASGSAGGSSSSSEETGSSDSGK